MIFNIFKKRRIKAKADAKKEVLNEVIDIIILERNEYMRFQHQHKDSLEIFQMWQYKINTLNDLECKIEDIV